MRCRMLGTNLIFPDLTERHLRKVCRRIRGQISLWIVDFVDHLLFTGIHAHQSATSLNLCHGKCACLVNLNERESEFPQLRYILVTGVSEIATRHLSRALQQMACQNRLSHLIRVVGNVPSELMHQRSDRQRRIGNTAGDDKISTFLQRFCDALRAHVDIRGNQNIFFLF